MSYDHYLRIFIMIIKVGHAHRKINIFCTRLLKLNQAVFCTCAGGFYDFALLILRKNSIPRFGLLLLLTASAKTFRNPLQQRWASTHANRSNAQLRLKTLPSIGRSNRSSFFKKPKILVAPSISMFKKVYCRS